MNIQAKLRWLLTAGVTESIGEHPVNRLQARPVAAAALAPETVWTHQARTQASQAADLQTLNQMRLSFEECSLKKTATHTLLGRGAAQPQVMCIAESPGAADDKEGVLFAGEAGALLDRMLAAVGLSLDANAYVSSLLPWRLPGNRKPSATEIALCLPFLQQEITLVKPQFLFLWGAAVSKSLLGIESLPQARGRWHTCVFADTPYPALVSISPALILKQPSHRAAAWEDLKRLQERLRPPAAP